MQHVSPLLTLFSPELLFFLRQNLTLLPMLECSGMISAHCNLPVSWVQRILLTQPPGITGVRHHAWLIFVFLVKVGFHHVGQVVLELLTSGDLPALTSQNAGIRGISHYAWLCYFISETGFHHVVQAGLKLLTSGDPLT